MERFTIKLEREPALPPDPPSVLSLVVVGALAVPPAWFWGMGVGVTALFALACIATRAARNHRRVQQTLRVAAITIFLSYAQLTIIGAFPPVDRIVFFAAITGAAMWFYETTV